MQKHSLKNTEGFKINYTKVILTVSLRWSRVQILMRTGHPIKGWRYLNAGSKVGIRSIVGKTCV